MHGYSYYSMTPETKALCPLRIEHCHKVFEADGLALDCVNRLKMAAQFGILTRTEFEIMRTTHPETIDGSTMNGLNPNAISRFPSRESSSLRSQRRSIGLKFFDTLTRYCLRALRLDAR